MYMQTSSVCSYLKLTGNKQDAWYVCVGNAVTD
jgi:hypothetical protein